MLQGHQIPFKMVGEQLHHGPVVGLSMCAWKPLFMTCGQLDRTVRVWNYETETQELVKQYQDEIFSVAIHPTGKQQTAQSELLFSQYICTTNLKRRNVPGPRKSKILRTRYSEEMLDVTQLKILITPSAS